MLSHCQSAPMMELTTAMFEYVRYLNWMLLMILVLIMLFRIKHDQTLLIDNNDDLKDK